MKTEVEVSFSVNGPDTFLGTMTEVEHRTPNSEQTVELKHQSFLSEINQIFIFLFVTEIFIAHSQLSSFRRKSVNS